MDVELPDAPRLEIELPMDGNGLTLRAALDRLVALDSRYTWTDENGRMVFRPAQAEGRTLDRRIADVPLTRCVMHNAVERRGGVATTSAGSRVVDGQVCHGGS